MHSYKKLPCKLFFCIVVLCQMTNCGTQNANSDIKVTNGFVTTQEPAVTMLRDGQGRGFCTGTFVNDQTMITAAHCVYSGTRGYDYPYVQQPNGVSVKSVNAFVANETIRRSGVIDSYSKQIDQLEDNLYYNYACDESSVGAQNIIQQMNQLGSLVGNTFNGMQTYDLAVVVFPIGTGTNMISQGGRYLKVMTTPPAINQKIKLLGYGNYNKLLKTPANKCYETATGDGFGTKRFGYNEVKTSSPYLTADGVYSASTATKLGYQRTVQSSVAQGDSGGPIIVCKDSINCAGGFFGAVNSTSSFGGNSWGDFTGTPTYSAESLQLMRSAISCDYNRRPCAPNFL